MGGIRIALVGLACLLCGAALGEPGPDPTTDPVDATPRHVSGVVLVKLAPGSDADFLYGLDELRPREVRPVFAATRPPRSGQPGAPTDLERWHRLTYAAAGDATEVARALRARGDVEHAEANLVGRLAAIPNDTYAGGPGSWSTGAWRQSYPDLWGLANIAADLAWDIHTGNPDTRVALVDSGLDLGHPDIQGNVWSNPGEIAGNSIDDDGNGYVDDTTGWSFAYDDNDVTDRFWHGTHMSGIIAAVGNNATGIAGVMWRGQVMVVKSFNDFGEGTLDNIAAGIVYAADNGAQVINLSFSFRGQPSELLRDAVVYAHDLGAVVVAAAGNSNAEIGDCNSGFAVDDPVSFPGCFREVIAVGSVDRLDQKTDFSNRGIDVDVMAPGGDSDDGSRKELYKNVLSLRSAVAPVESELTIDGDYYRNRGTSMAAAYVSGLAGLALSHRPTLGHELVRALLQESADDLGAPGPDATFGHGRVNAHAALVRSDVALQRAELSVWDLRAGKRVLPEGAPLTIDIVVRNDGKQAATDFDVQLYDGDPDAGGVPLAVWSIAALAPESLATLRVAVVLTGRGEHELYAVADPTNGVAELYEGNNHRIRPIQVYPYRFVETRITNAIRAQDRPDISGDRIVWHDFRDDPQKADLWLHDLATGTEQRVTTSPWYEEYPAIDGDAVVWQDLRERDPPPGTWDIYRHDLATGTEHRVSQVSLCPGTNTACAEISADVSGDWIAWLDARNGLGNADIYAHNIATGEERQITTSGGNQEDPSVSGTRLAFEDWRNGHGDIYVHDLVTGQEQRLTTDPAYQTRPAMSGDLVVFEDQRHGDHEIYAHDLASSQEQRITDAPGDQFNPAVSGNFIVWQDGRSGQWDIYLRDVAAAEERRVTVDFRMQRGPAIDGRRIVWADFRHADPATGLSFEIYLGEIDDFPGAPSGLTASPGAAGEIVLSWNAVVEAEGDLDEYRIHRGLSPGGPYEPIATSATPSYTDAAAVAGLTYYYRVTALDAGVSNLDGRKGEGPYSNEAAATASGSQPGAVAGLRLDKAGADLVLSWDASCGADASDYAIYEGALGDWTSHLARACSTAGATSATIAPDPGDRYFLVVPVAGGFEGSYGTTSSGSERARSAGPCVASQSLVPCGAP